MRAQSGKLKLHPLLRASAMTRGMNSAWGHPIFRTYLYVVGHTVCPTKETLRRGQPSRQWVTPAPSKSHAEDEPRTGPVPDGSSRLRALGLHPKQYEFQAEAKPTSGKILQKSAAVAASKTPTIHLRSVTPVRRPRGVFFDRKLKMEVNCFPPMGLSKDIAKRQFILLNPWYLQLGSLDIRALGPRHGPPRA